MAAWEELTIAEGTEWETLVLDVRHVRKWCEPSGGPQPRPPALIVWHHTVGNPTNVDQDGQLQAMRRMADVDTLVFRTTSWYGRVTTKRSGT